MKKEKRRRISVLIPIISGHPLALSISKGFPIHNRRKKEKRDKTKEVNRFRRLNKERENTRGGEWAKRRNRENLECRTTECRMMK